ncbi:MAG: DUF885 domain-containing protein [Myxococcales bacterium]|nr:DUF885 domain-containing protein [Myxococcales bacterium]
MIPLLALLFACPHRPATAPSPAIALNPEAVAGVTDPALRSLLHDHWEDALRRSPTWATALGDHRFDDQMPITGPAANAAAIDQRKRFLARARAVPPGPLSASDRLTLSLFVDKLETDGETDGCHTEQWWLSARTNPVVDINGLAEAMPINTPQDGKNYVARLRQSGAYMDGAIANLREGIREGRTPTATSARLVLQQVEDQLKQPNADWALTAPARRVTAHPAWSPEDAAAFQAEVQAALPVVRAAYEAFRDFMTTEELPAARPDSRAGTLYLPDGAACYTALVRSETSLALDPAAIHQTGLTALEGIHAELRELGASTVGTTDLPTLLTRLRSDPALYFTTGAEVQAAAEASLARAAAAMPRTFGRLPQAACTVKPIPDYEAPYTYIAYYNLPIPGERGGEYRINLSRPETRARFEMEALSWHEAIPGHHLQIAIAQELPDMPAFRKNLSTTAFVEGWALYTERLADEMGLYSSDLDRIGMLSFDAWRASRLVVDTGIHAKGWTREQAVRFMLDNTALAPNNIDNEVDRYITWPGQACGYKIGQIEVWKLRREAERRLGPRFDIKAFHDVVLGQGAVTLPVLRAQVEGWIVGIESDPAT